MQNGQRVQHPIIDNMLPIALQKLLANILLDNTLINWRIYGGNSMVLSIKFESRHVTNHSAAEEATNHSRPLMQQYGRKSPCHMRRDRLRYESYRGEPYNSPVVNGDQNKHSDQYRNTGSGIDMDMGVSPQSPEDTLYDSGFSGAINSTILDTNTSQLIISPGTTASASVQTMDHYLNAASQTSGNTHGQDKLVQTELPKADTASTQTVVHNKMTQTKQHRVHKCNKAIQLRPVCHDTTSQTTMIVSHDVATHTAIDLKRSKDVQTDPPVHKHVQTFPSSKKTVSVLVLEKYDKWTQTGDSKNLKKDIGPQASSADTVTPQDSEQQSDSRQKQDLVEQILKSIQETRDIYRNQQHRNMPFSSSVD